MHEETYSKTFTLAEIEEGHYNAMHSLGGVSIKPFTGKNEQPLRRMERQHLPLGHEARLSYEERMYRLFRDYRSDIEHGRIAASKEEYHRVNKYTYYYQELFLQEAQVMFDENYSVPVDISTPKGHRAYQAYYWCKTPADRESALRTLLRYTKRGQVNRVILYRMYQAGIFSEEEARA